MPIDYSVSKGAKEQLELGLRWHEEGHSGDGLLPSTVAEARRLISTGKWWPSKVKRAYSFFSRHGVQAGPVRDDKGRPTPKAVAWALWGGDAGFVNVKRIRESMLAEERRRGNGGVFGVGADDETTGAARRRLPKWSPCRTHALPFLNQSRTHSRLQGIPDEEYP